MNAAEAYARLTSLGVPVLSTADAATALGVSGGAANKILSRLAKASLVFPVRRGTWALSRDVDPLVLPEHLTAPYPAYVSLWTALYHRGVVEQIPATIYAVSLGRSRQVRTPIGAFSIHRVAPEVFGGFDQTASGVKLATTEKALFDVAYLSATRDRRFASFPEMEIPRALNRREVRGWIRKITSPRLAEIVTARIGRMVG